MKKILTIIVYTIAFTAIGISLNAQGVKWEKNSLEKVLLKAQKLDKLVFIDCYTSWCAPCKWMATNVFSTKEAGDYFDKYFVSAKYDTEKEEDGKAIAKKYAVRTFPTFLILDCTGNEIGRILGKSEFNEFVKKIGIIRNKDLSPSVLENKIKETGDIQYLHQYVDISTQLDQHDHTGELFNKLWKFIDNQGRYYKSNIKYLPRAIQLRNPIVLNDILENKSAYDNSLGKAVVDYILVDGLKEEFWYFFTAPAQYNKENINADIMDKASSILKLLDSDNAYTQFLVKAANAQYSNNNEELIKLLDVNVLAKSVTLSEIMRLKFLVSGMNIPQEVKEKFTQDLKDYLSK